MAPNSARAVSTNSWMDWVMDSGKCGQPQAKGMEVFHRDGPRHYRIRPLSGQGILAYPARWQHSLHWPHPGLGHRMRIPS